MTRRRPTALVRLQRVQALVDRFTRRHVLVIGDVILDEYLLGEAGLVVGRIGTAGVDHVSLRERLPAVVSELEECG